MYTAPQIILNFVSQCLWHVMRKLVHDVIKYMYIFEEDSAPLFCAISDTLNVTEHTYTSLTCDVGMHILMSYTH